MPPLCLLTVFQYTTQSGFCQPGFGLLDKQVWKVYNRSILFVKEIFLMKRIAAALLALMLFLSACALALSGTTYPAWDGISAPDNSLCGEFGGNKLKLDFDAAADYSNVSGGFIQACFFAFDSGEQNYLEMYILLPQDAAAGDVFSSTSASMSSISLYEVSKDSDVLYFAGQIAGFAYPDGSSYEMRITDVQQGGGSITMAGTLNGTLCRFDADTPTKETLELKNLSFHFTLPFDGASAAPSAAPLPSPIPTPESSAAPFQTRPPQTAPSVKPIAPKHTMDPHPAFTLPPDYAII